MITEGELPATPGSVARAGNLRPGLFLVPAPSPRVGTSSASRPTARTEGDPGKWTLNLKTRGCNFSTSLLNILTQCNDDAITITHVNEEVVRFARVPRTVFEVRGLDIPQGPEENRGTFSLYPGYAGLPLSTQCPPTQKTWDIGKTVFQCPPLFAKNVGHW